MLKCLNILDWRKSTRSEVLQFLKASESNKKRTRNLLAVRTRLRPIDVYTYLRARFGEPNGIQNILRRDDSDNLFHWDYNIKGGEEDIYIAGASRETHFILSEKLTDAQWVGLIDIIRNDFRRFGAEKSRILKSLEKFVVFPNKYMALATLCSELHEKIIDTPGSERIADIVIEPEKSKDYEARARAVANRAMSLWGDALKLRLLTPIMAEAYINMLILVFCKDDVRNDAVQYEKVLRAKIPQRLGMLPVVCDGFERPVDKSTEAYIAFMRVIAKRNFALHGNVDPAREQIETVYFQDKVPLFVNPGHHIDKYFEQLEQQNVPKEVVDEYESTHLFLVELREYLSARNRRFFEAVITDSYPGYELKKRRATRLFPDHVTTSMTQGVRYDDQLDTSREST